MSPDHANMLSMPQTCLLRVANLVAKDLPTCIGKSTSALAIAGKGGLFDVTHRTLSHPVVRLPLDYLNNGGASHTRNFRRFMLEEPGVKVSTPE